jgi:hypothetical protein
MSTISAAVSRITDCQECYWINQSLLVGRLTLRESLRCVRMVLWDERRLRVISFREMHIHGSA